MLFCNKIPVINPFQLILNKLKIKFVIYFTLVDVAFLLFLPCPTIVLRLRSSCDEQPWWVVSCLADNLTWDSVEPGDLDSWPWQPAILGALESLQQFQKSCLIWPKEESRTHSREMTWWPKSLQPVLHAINI